MPFPLSPQTINAIAEVISGGGGENSIFVYRTGRQIKDFMSVFNVPLSASDSRVASLTDCLIKLNSSPEEAKQKFPKIIESAADHRNFNNDPERHAAVVEYLNRMLHPDSFKLVQMQNARMQLVELGHETVPLITLGELLVRIRFDTAKRDLDRALASSQTDPEDAVTAACSMVESVCRSLLRELGESIPNKKDIQGLYNALKRPLGLSPDRSDVDSRIADDVRQVLSGLFTVTAGIGSLRTHGGDAHGRERGSARLDARIARLSVHAASTLALFLIETWKRKKTRSTCQ
ncbi:MAG: hypothetical protein TH68_10705 [Candidatus Synechococcus spongiarum 142]|uniref:Abortive infection protein-like C-terminal domain-containing protein n=1 Tax=Candidatus Synechococcus spongiarum 142 TaxID=1608213 RepID=A0A6N3X273_9SYNE|nr:MAG: hypothetical protein TH68_10705 [Candidatus Synechococcus spongiarum 142]